MKRILFALFALSLLLPLVSCQSLEAVTTTAEETLPVTTPVTTVDDGPLVIPEGFCVGFARVDITPQRFPVMMDSTSSAESVQDKLYATCVAISDGDEVALLIHSDLKNTTDDLFENTARRIEKATGIPADHILINATHNHNAPLLTSSEGTVTLWYRNVYYPNMEALAVAAYRDLAPAEAFGGESDTTGFAFVRRYVLADGTYSGLHYKDSGSPAVRHFSEADSQLQVIKFTREGKKDIVLTNWQCHAAHAASTYNNKITADFVGVLRKGVESEMNVDFAYYTGASGNLNFSTKFSNLIAYGNRTDWQAAGRALVDKVKEACESATPLQTGEIRVATAMVPCTIRVDNASRLAQAREVNTASGARKEELIDLYGFHSKYEASSIVSRANLRENGPTEDVPLYALVCGEIAFATASYEMFDTMGMYVKENSPAKMTFICAYTNGSHGYIPDKAAFDSNGYETHCCRYERGTAETLADETLRLLNEAA